MMLEEKKFEIKHGDVIFIPKNTFHSVKTTSKEPLKVISIQAPYFDGKDRVFKD
jgi:mannose-6-phosphate isomerase-like protein (cupin superfamily)